ncbi:MAG: hypothetical protein A3H96_01690 [Acidobacteria bacterium RIFCSPLOWO2_02_FULL_67_36]|nr:MAG: hypothetical protein A3H96_01690 [Acidobacteria bacterium RIFCSPLOWO2_02_FULL_67_36]OFW19915.1 MAG: hypothetical protein A3G21_09880 [Acidobacteria bacterium RIFCSPLOWO2_12_FULL_66_21]
MRATAIAAGIFVVAALTWVGISGQAVRERPGPGSGIVDVRGTVAVSELPAVTVSRLPAVDVSRLPAITIAPYDFVRTRASYRVVWSDGESEDLTIIELGRDGWARVSATRWVNLALARSVETR